MARVGLRENPLTPVKHLGIGKQQLVEIAKALSKEVKLLILDEPTAALNDDDSTHLLDLLKGLQGKGITSIMISHKLNEIERVADAITILRDGRTIETLDVASRRRRRGPHHPRHGRPRPRAPLPRPHARHRRACSSRSRTGRSCTRRTTTVRSSARPTSPCARGEIVGIAGLMGAGPHRARAQHLRPLLRQPHTTARCVLGRQGGHAQARCTPPSRPASPTSARTARASGSTSSTTSRPRSPRRRSDKLRRGLTVDEHEEVVVAEGYRKSFNIKAPSVTAGVAQALRRQPAEGRAAASGCTPTPSC